MRWQQLALSTKTQVSVAHNNKGAYQRGGDEAMLKGEGRRPQRQQQGRKKNNS